MNEVPKIVQQRLQASVKTEAHLDANILTAFAEKSLNEREQERLLVHLAQCSTCRDVVALALPELEESALAQRTPATAVGWRKSWIRWAALAACVTVVGVVVTLRTRKPVDQPAVVAQLAMQSEASVSQSDQKVTPPELDTAQAAAEPRGSSPEKKSASNAPANVTSLHSLSAKADTAGNARDEARDALKAKDQVVAKSASSPAVPVTGNAFAPGENGAAKNLLMSKSSVNLAPRWTLTPDGALQRSLDAGKTWTAVTVASNASLQAIAASGSQVWVGGTAGSLYHSSDAGQSWSQVQPSAGGEALIADITGIEFTDEQHIRISAGSATWTTSDSGQTWQKK